MKVVLSIICWILVAVCAYFPFAYTHSEMDKQELKISHILVSSGEEAINFKKEIEEKTRTFEQIAEKHSLCESKVDKGNIGYNMRGRLIPEIEKVAFSLKKNVVSEPVNTKEGWFIMKVTDIKYFSDKENFARRYKFM